jgi:hypothetical protein
MESVHRDGFHTNLVGPILWSKGLLEGVNELEATIAWLFIYNSMFNYQGLFFHDTTDDSQKWDLKESSHARVER